MCVFLQGLTDTEADLSSMGSRPASRQVSCDISRDTTELPDFKPSSSFKSKMKSHDSGIFEKVHASYLSIKSSDSVVDGLPQCCTCVQFYKLYNDTLRLFPVCSNSFSDTNYCFYWLC